MDAAQRLNELRALLKMQGCDAFLLPTQDAFLSEYPPESAQRLCWLTGFDGSAGAALVLADKALFFTDGRYTLQARQQLDSALYEVHDSTEKTPQAWLKANRPQAVLAFDPWLHSAAQVQKWDDITLRPLPENPIDALWHGRPSQPNAPAFAHPLAYAGESSESKRSRLAKTLQASAALLAQPDGINWLLNIRGGDIAYNPLALCYALLQSNGEVVLISEPRDWPSMQGVRHVPLAPFRANPAQLLAEFSSLQINAASLPFALWQAARDAGCEIVETPDITEQAKAIKSEVEQEGIREAHRRDGRALTRFLQWFLQQEQAPDELSAAQKLEAFRRAESGDLYRGASFETISGAGANGAIVHYRVTPQSNRRLQNGDLYLVDSGGQYPDGTTDVTRTVLYGDKPASAEMIDRFTRVLKGHIALARAVFPKGTSGAQLDALARQYLWEIGEDYAHGTGHGVGSYLCVHEGPQRISKRGGDVALEAGMVLSNEPGYYQSGAYGIRLENLVLVVPADREGFLRFETLTLAPFDARLIDERMLSVDEKAWLADYEKAVAENMAAGAL